MQTRLMRMSTCCSKPKPHVCIGGLEELLDVCTAMLITGNRVQGETHPMRCCLDETTVCFANFQIT